MKPIIAIPATLALVYRAYPRKSLTPLGIVAATLTATVHAIHPWSVFFWLLVIFYLAGTTATKVKHDVKSRLTLTSTGTSGGETSRTATQVLANSIIASILILLHAYALQKESTGFFASTPKDSCFTYGLSSRPSDILVVGIVANYAAVAADTLSSELGILSPSLPRLITAPWKVVAKGTNGGVTLVGLVAGAGGAALISLSTILLVPFCAAKVNTAKDSSSLLRNQGMAIDSQAEFFVDFVFFGVLGTVLDSLLGAVLQASVVDVRTGKVVEGEGGGKVMVHATGVNAAGVGVLKDAVKKRSGKGNKEAESKVDKSEEHHESREVRTGADILSNNGVNSVMALSVSLFAMALSAYRWGVDPSKILS